MIVSNPNTDFWAQIENEESYTDLVMAIEFSNPNRVSLFIAVCDVDQVQQETIDRYTKQLSPDFRAYQVNINHQHLSVSKLVSELIEQEPYLQNAEKAIISVVGATGLSPFKLGTESTKSDRDTFFGYLQWTRESFNNFHLPIVLWVSKNIYDLMLSETPDFWSWREGVFFFKSDVIETNIVPEIVSYNLDNDRELDLVASESISIKDMKQLIDQTFDRDPESPLLITLYNRFGRLYIDRLNTEKYDNYEIEQNIAIECFQKAINLASKSSTNYRNDLATSLNNLAGLYESQGRWAEAEPYYDEALVIYRELFGDRPNNSLATSLNNLAGLYKSQGRWAEAEHYYDEALAIRRELFGNRPNNSLAASLNNLAGLYKSQGRWAEAEPYYDEALAIYRELFGDRPNSELATSLNNLAKLYRVQGRWAEAEPLYVQALEMLDQSLGTNHPNTQIVRNNLEILRQQLVKPRMNWWERLRRVINDLGL